MGGDPATVTTNLLLFHYEDTWIRKAKTKVLITARKFVNDFYFVDDLAAINLGGEFEKVFHEIYYPKLELN